jgi:hypothetical protein
MFAKYAEVLGFDPYHHKEKREKYNESRIAVFPSPINFKSFKTQKHTFLYVCACVCDAGVVIKNKSKKFLILFSKENAKYFQFNFKCLINNYSNFAFDFL